LRHVKIRLVALRIVIYPDDENAEEYSNNGWKIEVPKGDVQGKIVDLLRKHDSALYLTFPKIALKKRGKGTAEYNRDNKIPPL
jgi:hypothetical protein